MDSPAKLLTLSEAEEHFEAQPGPETALVFAQVAERLWLVDKVDDDKFMACLDRAAPHLDMTVTKIMEKKRA